MIRTLLALLIVTTAVGAAAGAVPPPSADEVRIGRQLAQQLESRYPVVTDPALNEQMNRIAKTIVPVSDRDGVNYVFKILDVEVANAVSLPGGWIYVTKPMFGLVRSDHELAALLAHEIVHVAHAHGMEMQRRQTQAALITILIAALTRDPNAARGVQLASIGFLAHFTRDLERDADLTAVTYLAKTPYAPVGMLTLMERFAWEEQFRPSVDAGAWADHPKTIERIAYIEEELRRRNLPVIRRISANYLRLAVREIKETERTGGELLLNEKPLLRLSDIERVRDVSSRLDRLFNADLRSFEVALRQRDAEWVMTARGVTIATLTAQDAAWNGLSLRDLAVTVYARLRAAMEEDLRRRKLTG
ncbi:MAG TPA: M48 family metalloprotease [bacterium]|jgi:predicted Zn-dependent protease|nr:M48 family metalloprotease [bacterium]